MQRFLLSLIAVALTLVLWQSIARAVTDTWDGGGADNNLTTNNNWADNTAPLSDINNTDIIFAGTTRLSPNLSTGFSTKSVTFNNTAGAFTIGGSTLSVGAGGITNNDADTDTFNNTVSFLGTTNATINAASGGLTFTGAVNLPTGTLTVDGPSATSFANFGGATALTKQGAGTMTWKPSTTHSLALRINDGTLTMGADGSTDVFGSTTSIAVNGTSHFNINENMTLNGQLSSALVATITIAAGKTLTVQSGGAVNITSNFGNSTASTIVVTGNGSSFTTNGQMYFAGGSSMNVASGGQVSSGSSSITISSAQGDGTVTVDGSGSSLNGGSLILGLSSGHGSLTFSNSSSGAFGALTVGDVGSFGGSGTLNVQNAATVTAASLDIASDSATSAGTVTITGFSSTTGDHSALTIAGSGTTTIGATSGSIANMNVDNHAIFTSGAGAINVNPAGVVAVTASGTFNVNGDMSLKGSLTCDGGSFFTIAAGKTLTVQNGGDALFAGSFSNNTASTIAVTGTGSTFTANGSLNIDSGGTLNVTASGQVSSGGTTSIGNGTATVDGSGSSLNGGALSVGNNGNAGSLTYSNSSSGTFGALNVDNSASTGTNGSLNVQSGATLSGTSLSIATNAIANSGTVIVADSGSMLTVTGAGTTIIGAASASTGRLTLQPGTTFNSGTGAIAINATGTVAINGSTFNANGDMFIEGKLTRGSMGTLNIAAGRTLTAEFGGDATLTGNFTNSTASTIAVTGAGSTFTTSGTLTIAGNSVLNVTNGGLVSAGSGSGTINIGTAGNGTASVDGSGSSFTAGIVSIAQNGNTGSLTFSNNSSGTCGALVVDGSGDSGSNATLNIQSGATVSATSSLNVAPNLVANMGTINITGAGSALTLTGAAAATFGAAGSSVATLNVQSGGTFTTGTGTSTLNTTGTININGGTVNFLGPLTRNGGTLNFNSGALKIVDIFTVGDGGLLGANVTLDSTRSFTTTTATIVDAFHSLTLNGGTLNTGSLVINGGFTFIAGTLGITQNGSSINIPIVTGNPSTINVNANLVSLGSAASFNGFNHQGTLNIGAGIVTLNSAGYARLGSLTTLAGGTINAPNGVTFPSGANFLGHGDIDTQVTGELGSVIEADGPLFLGNYGAPDGFTFGGQLRTKQYVVHLAASSQVGLGNLTTLGNGSSPGSLSAINGLVVDFAESITGYGGIDSNNSLANRTIINGLAQGNSAAQPLTFDGYVKGAGTFNNVVFNGTFSPGLSPTLSTVGSITLGSTNTLIMELGGTTWGSQYDAILASGNLAVGGTLQLSLINGFTPAEGNSFDLLDWNALSGTFSSFQLPALSGSLAWDTSKIYTTGTISVALPGDFNLNGVVDAADYVVWRKGLGTTYTQSDYDIWRAHFGQTAGSGSGAVANAAVPEPATLAMLMLTVPLWCSRRRAPGSEDTFTSTTG